MIFYRHSGAATLITEKLLDKGFVAQDLLDMQEALDGVCTECWDAEEPCHCWNDE
jgi:hypothetical protein